MSVTADPPLSPGYARGVHDYVVRCVRKEAVHFSVTLPAGARASFGDSGPWRTGTFSSNLPLRRNQATTLVVRHANGGETRRHIRCLPPDVPRWSFRRDGRGQAQWYLFAPLGQPLSVNSRYVILMNDRGTPVWWYHSDGSPFNTTLLPDGQLAWTRWRGGGFGQTPYERWEIHGLDGARERVIRAVGSPTDVHDMEPLPNGNFLALTYRRRDHVDLRPYVDDRDATVWDGEIQEIDPSGAAVWSWSTKDHIPLSDTHWNLAPESVAGTHGYDLFHLNSVQPDGDALIVSGRHTDAVYKVDRATGKVLWKLGGTTTPQSLKVTGNDEEYVLIAQHDARLLPDGTVTVYDNNRAHGPPSAVRFKIDEKHRTARVVERIRPPDRALRSMAEGSARRLAGGDWVVSWGATPFMSELRPDGSIVWQLELSSSKNFRVTPIPHGRLSAERLRAAMDRMAGAG